MLSWWSPRSPPRGWTLVISVGSGKGGTGKTTLAVNLAHLASIEDEIFFLDCDAEDPDSHFYLKPEWESETDVETPIPRIDKERCDYCGKCSEICPRNALAVLRDDVLVFPELCYGCGGCALSCPMRCVTFESKKIGSVKQGRSGSIRFYQGLLEVGEPSPVRVIKNVKENIQENSRVIIDCPPGTGCALVESVRGSDYCLLVTEPSPFRKHDLELAHQVCVKLEIPHGVVTNRSNGHDEIIDDFCSASSLEILGRIPFSREVAQRISRGELLVDDEHLKRHIEHIFRTVQRRCSFN